MIIFKKSNKSSGVARRRKVGGGAQTFSQKVTAVLKRKIGGIVDRERAYNLMHFLLKY